MAGVTEQITIRVSPEVAKLYREAGEQQRQKLDLLIQFRLLDYVSGVPSLEEICRRAGEQAQAAGLTDERLRELLDER